MSRGAAPVDPPQICFESWGEIPGDDPNAIRLRSTPEEEVEFLQRGFYMVNDGRAAHEIAVESFEIEPSVRVKSKPIARIAEKGKGFALVWLDGHPPWISASGKWNLLGSLTQAFERKYGALMYAPDLTVPVSVVYRDAEGTWYRSRAKMIYIRSQGRIEFSATSHEICGPARPPDQQNGAAQSAGIKSPATGSKPVSNRTSESEMIEVIDPFADTSGSRPLGDNPFPNPDPVLAGSAIKQGAVPLISAKDGEQLEEQARKLLPQLKEDFRAYAEQMHASRRSNGWASLSAGRTERYVDCFVPMVEDLVPPCLLANGNQAEDPELVVWNLIEGAVNASLDVPTDPWMPAELFSNCEFRAAMLARIRCHFPQREAESIKAEPTIALPEVSFPADYPQAIKVAQNPLAEPHGKEGLSATQGQVDLIQEPFRAAWVTRMNPIQTAPDFARDLETINSSDIAVSGANAETGAPTLGNRDERLFRKEGESWRLVFEGRDVHVIDRKGLGHIANLLRSPNKSFHCLELLAAQRGERQSPVLGSAGETLDRQAFEDYRLRVEDLEDRLRQAERNQDQGQKELLQAELEQVTDELQRATGLGGRHRQAHDDAEKIRKGVCNAITRAIEAIREHHPELADHLKLRIKLGLFVSYEPDASSWEL